MYPGCTHKAGNGPSWARPISSELGLKLFFGRKAWLRTFFFFFSNNSSLSPIGPIGYIAFFTITFAIDYWKSIHKSFASPWRSSPSPSLPQASPLLAPASTASLPPPWPLLMKLLKEVARKEGEKGVVDIGEHDSSEVINEDEVSVVVRELSSGAAR